jgi:hypothetical protein
MTLYGGLLRLYPRAFRDEYGEDMVLLLQHQLRDESAARVWARTLLDLAVTVPSRRLEAHMSARTAAPVVYGAAAVASLAFVGLVGTSVGVTAIGIAGGMVFGTLAVIAWRREQAVGSPAGASAHWWQVLLAGALGLIGTIALVNANGELPSGWWVVFMGALLTSLGLLAEGVILGITRAMGRRTA